MLWLKGILFTLFIPASVAGLMPWWLTRNRNPDIDWGNWHFACLSVFITGVIIYFITLLYFLVKGGGTPAIWFTKAMGWLIGKEPVNMVSSGLYKYSPNPMYLGVIITVLGEGIYLEHSILLKYSLVLFIIFHLVVVLIEEPHLRQKFGDEYEQYTKRTRRWF